MKSYFYKILIIFILSIEVISCKNENKYEVTENGVNYRFFVHNENARKPAVGEIIEINMRYYTEDDSLLFDTKEVPGVFRMQVKDPKQFSGTIDEGLVYMNEGDSAEFLVDASFFYLKSKKVDVPSFIKSGSKLKFYIKINKILTLKEFEDERSILRVNEESDEMNLLKDYLQKANITINPSPTGLYYIEELKGNGRKPRLGNPVVINYTGKFIDGQIFDSSYDRNEPFKFIFGTGQVVSGLDEGLSNMSEGGRAILIIPSIIGYSDKGKGEKIPPFSTLIFEVELIKVLD
ncbi:MAG: hypothetical protein A2046_04305 [Bacteroidetes bacterium GWA2_30_7]|nr:MAG: hypothetical protein A2046_04305 [Bacteroidetes bacterium GWA2_30_7]